ncbi:MAG: hypothetical protein MUD01_09520 [Chloroflexaceae bacterium]|jgi:hypothetical protein|nr:hypothetical protein [Chloroflexaceae bacterium]
MTTISPDDLHLKALFKEALTEVLDQRRDWFLELVSEALEDAALVQAIKEGEETETVSRDEVFRLLGASA